MCQTLPSALGTQECPWVTMILAGETYDNRANSCTSRAHIMVQTARKCGETSTCSSFLHPSLLQPRGKTGPSPQGYLKLLLFQRALRTKRPFSCAWSGLWWSHPGFSTVTLARNTTDPPSTHHLPFWESGKAPENTLGGRTGLLTQPLAETVLYALSSYCSFPLLNL